MWGTHHLLLGNFRSLWRRKWQPTPVLLPGESHGWRSLVGYSPWDRKESDMIEWLHFHFSLSLLANLNYIRELSTIITMLYIISSGLVHLITKSWYSFTNLSLFCPLPASVIHLFLAMILTSFSFFLLHTSGTMWYLSLSGWLISLSIMLSRFIFSLSIHLSNGHLSCFHFLAICE